MSEDGDKARVFYGLTREIRALLIAGKKDFLRRTRRTIGLHPAAVALVQRAMPQGDFTGAQGSIGNFQHDAAHIADREEVGACELQVVEGALRIEEERIA